ncbi:MAG: hypothetical protein Tsb009_32790 [Planctomycetaceae bacterium]
MDFGDNDRLSNSLIARFGSPSFRVPGFVEDLKFSSNDQLLFVSVDETMRAMDAETGKSVQHYDAPDGAYSISVCQNDRFVAYSCGNCSVRVIDLQNDCLAAILPVDGFVSSLCFYAGGARLMSGSGGGDLCVRIWETATWKQLVLQKEPGVTVPEVDKKTLRQLHKQGLEPEDLVDFGLHEAGHLTVYPDDSRVAMVGDNAFGLWEMMDGELRTRLYRDDVGGTAISYVPSRNLIVTGGEDGKLVVRDGETGSILQSISAHDDEIVVLEAIDRGKEIVSGGEDGTLRFWDSQRYCLRHELTVPGGTICSLATSHDQNKLICSSRTGTLHMIPIPLEENVNLFLNSNGLNRSIDFSEDGQFLVTGASTSQAKILNVADNKVEKILNLNTTDDFVYSRFIPGHNKIAFAETNGWLQIWNTTPLEQIKRWETGLGRIFSYDVARDGHLFAVGNENGAVSMWSSQSCEELARLPAHNFPVNHVAILDQSNLLVTGTFLSGLTVWNLNTEKQVGKIPTKGEVKQIARSDGDRLAVIHGGGEDWGEVQVDVRELRLGRVVFSHRAKADYDIQAVSLSPNGKYLAIAAGLKGRIHIYHVDSGKKITTFHGQDCKLEEGLLRFSPDGKYLASGGSDTTIMVWDFMSITD